MDSGDSTTREQAPDRGPPVEAADPQQAADGPEGPASIIARLGRWATSRFGVQARDAGEEAGLRDALAPVLAGCNPGERAMIVNILKMRDRRVVDVMTPRADIEAVSLTDGLAAVIEAFRRGTFSRLPVYRDTLDDPVGFVHLKDIALSHGFDGAPDAAFDLAGHIRTALFVPASMRAAALLQKMQKSRIHMALVIDEFGGVDGLVTIEDLVEQIVGDIEDEHDEAELAEWREEGPGIFTVNARAAIADFEAAIGRKLTPDDWEEEVETLGGLVFMIANRVPSRGEIITHPGGHEFEVTDADPRRINRIRVVLAGAGVQQQPEAAE